MGRGALIVENKICLILQLLNKEPSARLGAARDIEEVRQHPFFASIDWDDLMRRRVPPPFVPNVVCSIGSAMLMICNFTSFSLQRDQMDLRNIDPEFTK